MKKIDFKNIDYQKGGALVKKYTPTVFANILRYVFFISLSYVLVYPFLYIIVNAFKSLQDAYDVTVTWVPKTWSLEHVKNAFVVFDVKNSLPRTIIYEVVTALIQFFSCAIAAYGLARYKMRGKAIMSIMMILTILVPSMMIIIPSYVNFSNMDILGIFGLIDKLTGVDIRPNLIGTPLVFYLPGICGVGLKGGLFIYIYSQFFKGLPKELEEAAWIDGAGPWKTFLTIVLPSSGSAMITVLLFSIIWHWNDLFLAQMYMNDSTFSTAISNFSQTTIIATLETTPEIASIIEVPVLLAGCFLFLLPMIIFYLAIQRKFVASIATSGIVG